MNVLADQDYECDNSLERQKRNGVFKVPPHEYVGVAGRGLKFALVCCVRKTSEDCPFDSVPQQKWSHRDENVFGNEIAILPDSMIVPFPNDSIVEIGIYYCSSCLYGSDLFK